MSGRPGDERVEGDRGSTLVYRAASLQARLSNLLAIVLIGALGVAALAWYYAHATRTAESRARAASARPAPNADATIPSIGRVDPPPPATLPDLPPVPASMPAAAADSPSLASLSVPPQPEPANGPALLPATAGEGAPAPKSATPTREERELSGAVFVPQAPDHPSADRRDGAEGSPASPSTGDLSSLLRPTAMVAVHAQTLPTRRLLLPKGSFIDCTLETAIDSTLPGLVTCVMATDAFGADGSVVLLERGTKLLGETRGQVQQGTARVFVLWSEARTPAGVIVPLASPGADELGRSGLPGDVNRHFWERFGAALLISVIDGATEGAVARGGSGAVVINPGASQSVTTEALRGTLGIAPTVTKRNGERIQVVVARDVDFRSVYELRSVSRAP